MKVRELSQPIVVAKPMRGREMQSTFIPKDVVETVRAVSAKQIEGTSIVEDLQKPREADVEIYHEGYVDGKLYLVPDTNLQAMRDIVNLKMRRRHSSAEKPQTSDEPTKYTEFHSKLDCLLDKIDRLADLTEDDSDSVEESDSVKKKAKNKIGKKTEQPTLPQSPSPPLESVGNEESEEKGRESEVPFIRPEEPSAAPVRRVSISPMMDENIKYIRVRPKDATKEGRPHSFGKQVGKLGKVDDLSEKFRLLVSGHLKNGVLPVFIVHQNYNNVNVLENEIPDFKTHKKEGNIDIFLTGKFFPDNILKQESSKAKAVLDIKPHKIEIDEQVNVHRKKFKDIYKVGPLDIALEGEFKKDNKTLKYTPVLSLDILKNIPFEEYFKTQTLSDHSISSTGQSDLAQPKDKKLHKSKNAKDDNKHVHYPDVDERKVFIEGVHKNKNAEDVSILSKIKNGLYKKLFKKKRRIIEDNQDKSSIGDQYSSSQQIWPTTSRNKREEMARMRKLRLRELKAKRGKLKNKYITPQESSEYSRSNNVINVYNVGQETQTPFIAKTESIEKSSEHFSIESKPPTKPKRIKKKKKDKNQAIVENPILAQMQEFFIA